MSVVWMAMKKFDMSLTGMISNEDEGAYTYKKLFALSIGVTTNI